MDALLDLAWKSSLLLACGAAAALLARRASAATRHLIWSAALLGALALPVATALLPAVRVAAFPAEVLARPAPAPAAAAAPPETDSSAAEDRESAPFPAVDSRPALPAASFAMPRVDWGRIARLVWATVALALLMRVAAGDLQLRRIARRAQRAVDGEWTDLLERCLARAPLRRPVTLLESAEVEVPITFGTLRPVVVVPAQGRAWSRTQKRAVLVHELAHVERHDALSQLLARVACALHWPNPLAWAASGAMRHLRERACDDRVLAEGARPTDYATSLLDVALGAHPRSVNPALAMARRGQLEGRLLAVLDPSLDRTPAGRSRKLIASAAAAMLVMPLGALRAERAAARGEPAARVREAAEADPAPAALLAGTDAFVGVQDALVRAQDALVVSRDTAIRNRDALVKAQKGLTRAHAAMRTLAQAYTPPTLPTPPTPPTPLTPPASHGSIHIQNNDGSTVWTTNWSDDNRSGSFVARGEVRWNDQADDIAGLSPGGSVDVTVHDGGHHWHAEILTSSNGGLTRTLLVDGAPRDWDSRWFASFLVDLDRRTGFAADVRFPKLYREGGARAVLAYVDRMDGDYGRRRYLQLLVARDPLDDDTAVAVFHAVDKMSGDYERSQVLKEAAAKAHLDSDAKQKAFLSACSHMHGDYERSQVLHELINQPQLSSQLVHGILETAAKLGGDYEKSQVLTFLAKKHQVDPVDFLQAVRVGGSYEHSRILRSLIETQKLDGRAQVEVIRHAVRLGDYEAAQVLVALTQHGELSGDARREYEAAADHLGDYSRKQVLAALSR
jgi:beta-lactamase regulating signal transducer with metallopeptidase domain